jgi:hypothetical protein
MHPLKAVHQAYTVPPAVSPEQDEPDGRDRKPAATFSPIRLHRRHVAILIAALLAALVFATRTADAVRLIVNQ